jgi:hypothetical protein
MKLLTHNILACHIKGVQNNYPFIIEAVQVETKDADFNPGAPCSPLACLRWSGPQLPSLLALTLPVPSQTSSSISSPG